MFDTMINIFNFYREEKQTKRYGIVPKVYKHNIFTNNTDKKIPNHTRT